MRPGTTAAVILAGLMAGGLVGCETEANPDGTVRFAGRKGTAQPGVTQVAPGVLGEPVAGQTLYIPAYGSLSIGEKTPRFGLGITLSVRNTDRTTPIVVRSADYHDAGGKRIRRFLENPIQLAPLAAYEVFLGEKDVAAGAASSFLVQWSAEHAVSAPLAESVMIGTAGTQGISFSSRGVVVDERTP